MFEGNVMDKLARKNTQRLFFCITTNHVTIRNYFQVIFPLNFGLKIEKCVNIF